MSNFSQFSRRKFLYTAGASAGAVLLKGCLGNPPEPGGGATTASSPAAEPIELSPEQKPETTKIKLGFIPILESAPLIVAKEKGFFAKYGMPDVEVSKQANWGSARDNVVAGSQKGGIDGGQWQMPMPHLISEGIITNGQKVQMYVLAQLSTQGNGIAIAKAHAGKGLHLDVSKAADYIKGFSSTNDRKFKAAYTFPTANQDFWIRYWFGAGGIDPDNDVDLLAVPPPETVQGMRNNTMDAFSTGDPWPYRIIKEDIGHMAGLTAQIWPFHPEEYLAIRSDWVGQNPKATKSIIKAVIEAQQWCDKPENRPELIKILAGRNYVNIDPLIITPPLEGKYELGDGQTAVDDFKKGPLYWKDDIGSVSYPYKSHDLWFLTESMRWNFHDGYFKDFDKAKEVIDKVNRSDLWVEAAKEAGIETGDIPSSDSRGVETFFDGVEFDPEKPQAYLDSLKIKRA
jgi:bicarbonate transport system substrate-binding protein